MGITNRDIVTEALAGRDAEANNMGNFWTMSKPTSLYSLHHWLSPELASIYNARREHITQVIYSFDTPIMWKDSGVWVCPDARYSVTTSAKHMSTLWKIDKRVNIPEDCGQEEYLRLLSGKMVYLPGYGKLGRIIPG